MRSTAYSRPPDKQVIDELEKGSCFALFHPTSTHHLGGRICNPVQSGGGNEAHQFIFVQLFWCFGTQEYDSTCVEAECSIVHVCSQQGNRSEKNRTYAGSPFSTISCRTSILMRSEGRRDLFKAHIIINIRTKVASFLGFRAKTAQLPRARKSIGGGNSEISRPWAVQDCQAIQGSV